MRTIPDALAAHLSGDATTTCQAWRVSRKDGVVLGFTDHDRDLAFDGTLFRAASGFAASEAELGEGMAASAAEVAGGFSNDAIAEADLAAGRFDGAVVELYLVNWADPSQHLRLSVREIGEVTRAGGRFTAELRSLAHRLDQPQGRLYNRRCDASLGDARCRVDLSAFRAAGTVLAMESRSRLLVAGLSAFATGFFDRGMLALSGGETAQVDGHVREADGTASLTLWLPLERALAADEGFVLTAGCDKSFSTCRARFGNHLNFRGFPHVPGSDFAYSYVDGERLHDGGALFS
ncbi:DUF2163 domain-containing protein [Rhizobium sp. CSW-27]|uniref:DUF2163 domain-containing protein n=1 Tax=Rhizobium sp. CSW-27 TaxID=2839985 RepID=UPI001C02A80B|nr:DUF2163 domain-containing protein [Rhizobium sp. CSW-27]MBT9368589.1 DUF2163 domain-containing protein [Rhizobium sp. CSW-27]